MVDKSDYSPTIVEAALGVLVEVMAILGEDNSRHVVLAGGWVPFFLVPQDERPHCGSIDIDLALDFENIPDTVYASLLERLSEKGYERDAESPAKFWRSLQSGDGREIRVRVDFLAGEYGGSTKSHRHQRVQDILAQKARGCDLAFSEFITVEVEAKIPDGSINREKINIAGAVPFLVMKGMALADRLKEKDAYDIGYLVKEYPGGPPALADIFIPYSENMLVREGLKKIRKKFESPNHWGPVAYVNFEQIDDDEDRELSKRDIFERVNALLVQLGI